MGSGQGHASGDGLGGMGGRGGGGGGDGVFENGDDVDRAADGLADGDFYFRGEPLGDVELGAGAELDHADAVATLDDVADVAGADDPPRDEANDLLNDGDGLVRLRVG